MNKPFLSDSAFLSDVNRARRDPHVLGLWWLGRSGFLVHWHNRFLLFDPFLPDAPTQPPSSRARVVSPERLDFIDVVTSSRHQADHLDAATFIPLLTVNRCMKLIAPEASRLAIAERLGVDPWLPLGLEDGSSVTVVGFRITGIPAARPEPEVDAYGRHVCLGFIVEAGPYTLYHSGGTGFYDGLTDRLRTFSIDVALLPIRDAEHDERKAGALGGREAAHFAHEAGARLVIPCGFHSPDDAPPEAFVAECERLRQPYVVLRPGERWSSERVLAED